MRVEGVYHQAALVVVGRQLRIDVVCAGGAGLRRAALGYHRRLPKDWLRPSVQRHHDLHRRALRRLERLVGIQEAHEGNAMRDQIVQPQLPARR